MRFPVLFLCAIVVGCGSDHSGPSNVSGNWTGMLNSVSSQNSRTIDLFTTQTGTTLSGPRAIIGMTQPLPMCDTSATMSGTVDRNQVTMNVVVPPNPTPNLNQTVVLTGSSQGGAISGTYTETSGCLKGDSGTFEMVLAPSITSSQWSGTWSGPFGSGGTAAANLVEDSSAKITGTLTWSGGLCVGTSPENVTGSLTGLIVEMVAPHQPLGQLVTEGQVDIAGKTLSLSRLCEFSTGRVMLITLTRP